MAGEEDPGDGKRISKRVFIYVYRKKQKKVKVWGMSKRKMVGSSSSFDVKSQSRSQLSQTRAPILQLLMCAGVSPCYRVCKANSAGSLQFAVGARAFVHTLSSKRRC